MRNIHFRYEDKVHKYFIGFEPAQQRSFKELRTRSLVSDSSIRNMRKLRSTCSETRRCLGFVAVHASFAYALSVLEKRLKAVMIILCILAVWGQGTDIRRRFNYSRNVSYILRHLLLEKMFSFRSIFYSLNIKWSPTSLELGLSRGKISSTRSFDIFLVLKKKIQSSPQNYM